MPTSFRKFALCSALMLPVIACGPAEQDATFSAGSGSSFGTLVDDRGTFTFMTGASGAIETIGVDGTANDGTITLPNSANNTNFSVMRDAGGEIEFDPIGDQVLISVRDDPAFNTFGLGDQNFQVARDQLGPLTDLLSARVSRDANGIDCASSRTFIDDTCSIIRTITIEDLATSIETELTANEVSIPRSVIVDFLNRYMKNVLNCCDAWIEYRDGGVDPCSLL